MELSVVMPARNAGRFIDQAIWSILSQSQPDFEFVILDDASQDNTWERLCYWASQDPRIRLLRSPSALGPARSSQHVVQASKGHFVARQDADDLSHPLRLEKQLKLLCDDPSISVVGSLYQTIDAQGHAIRGQDRAKLRQASPYNPCPHPSLMFRRTAFDQCGGYQMESDHWEDQALLRRLCTTGRFLVLTECLCQNRVYTPCRLDLVAEEEFISGQLCAAHQLGFTHPSKCAALYSLRCHHMWLGQRSDLLPRLVGRTAWPLSRRDLLIWLLALGSQLSPLTLRSALQWWLRWTDSRSGIPLGATVELAPPWGSSFRILKAEQEFGPGKPWQKVENRQLLSGPQ